MIAPSISETAFNCPHCEVLTTQHWHDLYVESVTGESRTPFIPPEDFEERVKAADFGQQEEDRLLEEVERRRSKQLHTHTNDTSYNRNALRNGFASLCYNCNKWTLWVADSMVYPPKRTGAVPNQDLPPEILAVVDEARAIITPSPRGAAALLRLSIQMLCKHLGKPGKNLNADIKALVEDGLHQKVQRAFDAIRVIGNESVHPGEIDLNDDRDTALRLFDLINIIAQQMISDEKQVDEMYEKIPATKREGIEKRDTKGGSSGMIARDH